MFLDFLDLENVVLSEIILSEIVPSLEGKGILYDDNITNRVYT